MDFSSFEPRQNERYRRFGEKQQRREAAEIARLQEHFPGSRNLGECRHFLGMSTSQFAVRIGAGLFIVVAFGGILILVLCEAPKTAASIFATLLAIPVGIGLWHVITTLVRSGRRTFLFDNGLLLLHRGRIQVYRWTDIERIEELRSTFRPALTSVDKYDFGRTEFKSRSLIFHLRGGRRLDLSMVARQPLLFAALAPIAERLRIPWIVIDSG
jgi:hypothetical protein